MIEGAMKRKIVFLLVLLGLAVLVGIVVKFLNSRTPKEGELRIESSPTASVFLDNKHMGRTPLREKVKAGEYTVKLVPESTTAQMAGWEGKITVGANLLTYVNSNLSESELTSAIDLLWLEKSSAKNPELSVVTNPDGATVEVDGQTKGVTPLSLQDLSAGDHTVVVSSPGFATRTVKMKTTSGYRVVASFKLALAPGTAPREASTSATTTPTATVTPKPGTTKTATASATTPDPPKPFVLIIDTPTGFLRVRMEPSKKATEAAQVKPGQKFTVFDNKTDTESTLWYEIKYDGTNTGWISGQYAEKVE